MKLPPMHALAANRIYGVIRASTNVVSFVRLRNNPSTSHVRMPLISDLKLFVSHYIIILFSRKVAK
jgi:hypothetical protein